MGVPPMKHGQDARATPVQAGGFARASLKGKEYSMKPLMVVGRDAFSQFRLTTLSEKVSAALTAQGAVRIEARFVYLLDVEQTIKA